MVYRVTGFLGRGGVSLDIEVVGEDKASTLQRFERLALALEKVVESA